MGERSNEGQPVKVFISYSWDDEEHREWVRRFATRLRTDGVETVLDRWHAVPGDQLPEFMEREVRESDFVLCICTPKYKERSDQRRGGVGYEGDVMTSDIFVNRNQRKFIPVLRRGEWKQAAPSWLMGKYYIDLRGDPYSEQNYRDLMATLRDEREDAPPVGGTTATPLNGKTGMEFVNREIELATLDPAKLAGTYWQCALVSAPTGYGKSRLLNRLIEKIEEDGLSDTWTSCYIDLQACGDPDQVIRYTVKKVTGKSPTSDLDVQELKARVCEHVLDTISVSPNNGPSRSVLFIIDSIDFLDTQNLAASDWISAVIHDVVVGSYLDYEKGSVSFPVRVIVSGLDTETFWRNYLKWEAKSQKYRLKPPKRLPLSAFDELAVQDMVHRKAKGEKIPLSPSDIPDISYELQYLSGGHPQVASEILNELAVKKFRMYKEYFRDNRERLIQNHISKVVRKVLRRFPVPQAQKEIKTICAFRLINLNTLERLRAEKLVSSQAGIKLLGMLCENRILNPPNAEKLFYHDDIIRRILYLDLVFGDNTDDNHVQSVHQCAISLYRDWIKSSRHSSHHFFVEWLFHALQVAALSKEDVITEWRALLSSIDATLLPLDDFKRAIDERLKADDEVKYLFKERLGSDDFSLLFDQ